MDKDQIINSRIAVEGGYVNDPNDSGGATNYGVTIAVAREYGYTGDMATMPRQVAFDVYSKLYWDSVKADQILALSESIAFEVVDTGINMGIHKAGILLQRVLSVLNNKGQLYPDLKIDGNIGPVSLSALGLYLGSRSEGVLLKALNCLQGAFYIELAERREKDEKFIYGWLKNRVDL